MQTQVAPLPVEPATPSRLTVLYDETCRLCRRVRNWLLTEPCFVGVELLPAGSAEARRRYPGAEQWLGKELVVVDERGNTWIGPAAYTVTMWATVHYRSWSYRLASPALAPFARAVFRFVTTHRRGIGKHIRLRDPGTDCSWCELEEFWERTR